MIGSTLKNKVIANASWLIIGRIIQMAISLIVGILTARYLGPGNYGLINYASAYTAFFTIFCTLGINSVIVKEFVDHKDEEGNIIGTAIGLRILSSVLSVITIMLLTYFLDADEPLTKLVVALCSIGLCFSVFDTFNYWFQSKLESKKTAIATLIAYSITSVYKVVLLITNKPVSYFALATSVDAICLAVILIWFYKRSGGGRLSFSWQYGKQLLGKSCHYILPGLMVAIYGQTDKIMLKQMISDVEIGYYATAVTICTMWCFVLNAIIDSLTPVIMQAHSNDKEKYEQLNRLLYCIVFYVSAAVSIIFTLFGGFIIRVLYGEAYILAEAPLMFITWYTAFSYLGVARNAWIVCENKQKYLIYIYVVAAISNVILNFILIPSLGAVGAAIASLIAQIMTAIIVPFFINGLRRNSVLMMEAIVFKGIR